MKLFKKNKVKVTIVLKSGYEFSFLCDEFKFNWHTDNLHVSGYEYKGLVGRKIKHIIPSEIAVIFTEQV